MFTDDIDATVALVGGGQRDELTRLGSHAARAGIQIGRDPDNDIVLDDVLVSRRHAEVVPGAADGVQLVDLGSSNGTFVNGAPIKSAALVEGDIVSIGHHLFHFESGQLVEYVDDGSVSFVADDLRVTAGSRTLLDGVSFDLDERSFLAVLGPSGSGKSTLLNALTGYKPAEHGAVRYAGRDLYASYAELGRRIGFVPQQDVVHPTLTVREELRFGATLRFSSDVSATEREQRVDAVLEEVGLTKHADTVIASLSGGQRRRVCVALELMSRPSLLFLDEPTSGLDPGYERSLMEQFRALADGGRTVVCVTHSMASLALCDRVLLLAPGGRTAYFGPPSLAAQYFGVGHVQEIFQTLSEDSDTNWGERFHTHPIGKALKDRTAAEPEPAPEVDRLRTPLFRQGRRWFGQFAMQSERFVRVLAGDRRNLALLLAQPVLLGVLMMVALPAHELSAAAPGEIRLVSRAGLVLLIVILGMTWIGASNAVREIVKELPILRRERAVGLSVSAYLLSKTAVLGALTIVQGALLVPIALARQGDLGGGAVLGSAWLEIVITGMLAGLAGMALGLLVSAISATVDRAMTVLPVILILQLLLAMGGVFPDIVDKPVLKQLAYATGAQWAFSATGSSIDLNRVQAVNGVARHLAVVDLRDPDRVLDDVLKGGDRNTLWTQNASTWLSDSGALIGLSVLCLGGAGLALVRRRPEA